MRKFYSIKKVASVCVALVMTLGFFGFSSDINRIEGNADEKNYASQIDNLENQQKEIDRQLDETDKKLKEASGNLEAINKKYELLQKKIKNFQVQAEKIENEMVRLDTDLRESQVRLDKQNKEIQKNKDAFMKRIRTMYIVGGAQSYSEVLTNSADFYDVLMRLELVKRVAKHDSDELDKLVKAKKEIEDAQKKIKEQSEDLKETAKEYADKQSQLAKEQQEIYILQQESAELIEQLKNGKADLSEKSGKLAEEYAEVSRIAENTTAVTTFSTKNTAVTSKKTSDRKTATTTTTKHSGTSSQQTTSTTAKTSSSPTQTESVKTTTSAPVQTTTTAKQTQKPVTTTKKPVTTTAKPPVVNPPSDQSKIDIVLAYAKSNVGGAYVWGGSEFRATDCSGLVMLSFAQVGMSLPHLASSQAYYGSAVSYNDMRPGDVIFFGDSSYSSIYHVAIYIGNGNMVHAQNSATGIVISNVASFAMYNHITVIKRFL